MSNPSVEKQKAERRGFRSHIRAIFKCRLAAQSTAVETPRVGAVAHPHRPSHQSAKTRSPTSGDASPSPSPPAPTNQNSELWRKAQAIVRADYPNEWSRFQEEYAGSSESDLETIVEALKRTIQECENNRWTVTVPISGSVLTPRKVLDKIVGYAEAFKDLGSSVAAIDPTQSAGVAWNALQFLVSLAVKNRRIHELVEQHETVSNVVFRCSVYAALHLDAPPANGADETIRKLGDAITTVYVRVLRYLMAALSFLGAGKIRKCICLITRFVLYLLSGGWERLTRPLVSLDTIIRFHVTATIYSTIP